MKLLTPDPSGWNGQMTTMGGYLYQDQRPQGIFGARAVVEALCSPKRTNQSWPYLSSFLFSGKIMLLPGGWIKYGWKKYCLAGPQSELMTEKELPVSVRPYWDQLHPATRSIELSAHQKAVRSLLNGFWIWEFIRRALHAQEITFAAEPTFTPCTPIDLRTLALEPITAHPSILRWIKSRYAHSFWQQSGLTRESFTKHLWVVPLFASGAAPAGFAKECLTGYSNSKYLMGSAFLPVVIVVESPTQIAAHVLASESDPRLLSPVPLTAREDVIALIQESYAKTLLGLPAATTFARELAVHLNRRYWTVRTHSRPGNVEETDIVFVQRALRDQAVKTAIQAEELGRKGLRELVNAAFPLAADL